MTSNDKIINPQTQMETSDLTRSQDSIEQSFFGLLICPSGASTNTSSGSSSSSSVSSIDNMNSMSFTDQDQTTTFESPLPTKYATTTSPPPLFFSNNRNSSRGKRHLILIPNMSDDDDEENSNDRQNNSKFLLPFLRDSDINCHTRLQVPQLSMQCRSSGRKTYHFWKKNDPCEHDTTNTSISGMRSSSSSSSSSSGSSGSSCDTRTGPEDYEFLPL